MRHPFEKDDTLVVFGIARFSSSHEICSGTENAFAIQRGHILTISKYDNATINSHEEVVWRICDATSSYYVYVHEIDTIQKLIKYIDNYDYSSLE